MFRQHREEMRVVAKNNRFGLIRIYAQITEKRQLMKRGSKITEKRQKNSRFGLIRIYGF